MNSKIIYVVIAAIVIVCGFIYWSNYSGSPSMIDGNMNATTTDNTVGNSTSTASTTGTNGTNTGTGTNNNTNNVTSIPGYPANWPTDVPQYPVKSVKYSAGYITGGKKQNAVIFSTPDNAKTVLNFYLTNLQALGWKITENGNGLANQITFRATKGTRSVGGYIDRTATSTNVTVGVNIGL